MNSNFNYVLFNWYEDGLDFISPHTDECSEWVNGSLLAVVSYMENNEYIRPFRIQDPDCKKNKFDVKLKSGSVLTISKEMQQWVTHGIPKRTG